MPLPRRRRHGLVTAGALLALALTGCASATDPAPSASDPTTSGTSPSPASTSASNDSSSVASRSTSTSSTSSASSTVVPDPEVSVTPTRDATQSSSDSTAGLAAADTKAPATRLSIPAVGLSTQIGPQGLREGKVNPGPGQVIWFTGYDRVSPGAPGTSVIAGHVVSGGRADSFAALEQLSKGDGVVLTYPGGATLRFEVTRTDIVDKDALTTDTEVWGGNSDTRRIVLVTCDDELGFRTDGHRKANFIAVAELPS